ncbi:MAG: hypothetical protein ABIO94_11700, partial [Opitutaceae bacterium]
MSRTTLVARMPVAVSPTAGPRRSQRASATTRAQAWCRALAVGSALVAFVPALRALDPAKSIFQFNV